MRREALKANIGCKFRGQHKRKHKRKHRCKHRLKHRCKHRYKHKRKHERDELEEAAAHHVVKLALEGVVVACE